MKLCAIIDGYGAAQPLPVAFQARGVGCVHVKTSPLLDPLYHGRFNPGNYLLALDYEGDARQLAHQLRRFCADHGHEIAYVIPGMEPGVELADTLSEQFSLPCGNGSALSAARRNKHLMHETLRAAGVPSITQFKSSNVTELIEWTKAHLEWPVIVKPLDSAGIDGVTLCHDEREVDAAFRAIVGKINLMGQCNREVLVQEYVTGDEYIVNGVSCQGRHSFVQFWKSCKIYVPGTGIIYDREVLLPFDGPLQEALKAYLQHVLDALGIVWGPTHAELKFNERGPMLIEVAARASGAANVRANNEALGHNQLDLTADAYVNPEAFARFAARIGTLRKQCWMVVAPSRQEGIVKSMPFLPVIAQLPSFYSASYRVKPGDRLKRTVDLNSCVGFIFLIHEDASVIARDYETVTRLIPEGFVLQRTSNSERDAQEKRRRAERSA